MDTDTTLVVQDAFVMNDAFVMPTTVPMGAALVPTHPRVADVAKLGDEIAALSAHLDAATYRLLVLIREFDERGGWGNGFRSCAEWLSWRVGLDPGAARERVRVARALVGLRSWLRRWPAASSRTPRSGR